MLRLYMPDPEAKTKIVEQTLSLIEQSGVTIKPWPKRLHKGAGISGPAVLSKSGERIKAGQPHGSRDAGICTLAVISGKALESEACREVLSALTRQGAPLILLYTEEVNLPPGLDLQLSPIQSLYADKDRAENLAAKILESPQFRDNVEKRGYVPKVAALAVCLCAVCVLGFLKAGSVPRAEREDAAKAVFFLPDSWSERQREQVSDQIVKNASVLGVDKRDAEQTGGTLSLFLEEQMAEEITGDVVRCYLVPPVDLNLRNDSREEFFQLTTEDIEETELISVTLSGGRNELPLSMRMYGTEAFLAKMTEGRVLHGVRFTLANDFLEMFSEILEWTPEDVIVMVRNFASDDTAYDYASVTEDHRIELWSLSDPFSEQISHLMEQNLLQQQIPSVMHSTVVLPHLAQEKTSADFPEKFAGEPWAEVLFWLYEEEDPDRSYTAGEKLDRDTALRFRLDSAGIPYILGFLPSDGDKNYCVLRLPEEYFSFMLLELLCMKDLPDRLPEDLPSYIEDMVSAWDEGTALPAGLNASVSYWVDEEGNVRDYTQITDHLPYQEAETEGI